MSKCPSSGMDSEVEVVQMQGQDREGRQIVTIVAKFLPEGGVVNKYLEEKILGKLGKRAWCMVYVHTGVQTPLSLLTSFYNALPSNIKHNLEAIYFIHPSLYHRLFFATFGRFLFTPGLYWKLKYVDRLEFLWEHVRRKEMEVPEFVYDHEKELEYRPMMMDLDALTHHHSQLSIHTMLYL
ncbi:ganglioside-induced differentiation-associated protein 2 [Senna tora]|uniref:Ganglioside-induced differentiation-associated protein 2 n=1 Tax=Senna tora TaxID=362788 RepID=A0A834TWS8_9FABA|nr:ganglioside-induced differentiation-associated protein 2 [Senna tora]